MYKKFQKGKTVRIKNLVYYIANSCLKNKRSIKEFLKRMVLILRLKQVSFLRL